MNDARLVVTIRLVKPLKGRTIAYEGELLARTATSVVVQARWTMDAVDLGLLRFAPGDLLVEHYYSDRWYNIFELYDGEGTLKGWYCNVTRPALITFDEVLSEDLELDLLVSPDRSQIRLDDEDEFAARLLERDDPAAYAAALAAVEELKLLVAAGAPPFDRTDPGGARR